MEAQTYTFYAPCPVLDMEAMQTWLEDMSMEGYLLKSCSKARHQFKFYKIEPLRTRYRLTPVSNKIEQWNLRPDEEFVSITDAFGWEYVCSNYRMHIFRAYDEDAREIHTDPAIQAQAIRQLGRQILKTALIWMVIPFAYFLIILAFGGKNYFWQSLLLDSMGIQIVLAWFLLFAVVKSALELTGLCPLYRQLKRGFVPIKRKSWKKKAPVYRAVFRAYPIFLVILALVMVMSRGAYRDNAAYQELPPVGTELPFLSAADMVHSSDVRSAERMEDVNYMRSWSHILSPVNYDWAEIVEVVDNNGTEGLVSIHVRYHEPRFGWLAESLTMEYIENAKQTGTEMTENPQTGADSAYFYYNQYGDPAAVLKYGHCVVCVEFPCMDIDTPTLKFEYWIKSLNNALSHE